jgi:hypothetical protein
MSHAARWAISLAGVEFVMVTLVTKYLGRAQKIGWGTSIVVAACVTIVKLYGIG